MRLSDRVSLLQLFKVNFYWMILVFNLQEQTLVLLKDLCLMIRGAISFSFRAPP